MATRACGGGVACFMVAGNQMEPGKNWGRDWSFKDILSITCFFSDIPLPKIPVPSQIVLPAGDSSHLNPHRHHEIR